MTNTKLFPHILIISGAYLAISLWYSTTCRFEMADNLSPEALSHLAQQPIYEGIDRARRDEIRRARRRLALLHRLGESGGDTMAIHLMLQQDDYARGWEDMDIWPEDD